MFDITTHSRRRIGARPLRVVVAGGGVAGLETVLALHELAGDLVDITLLAADPDFVYRPSVVGEPFAHGGAHGHTVEAIVGGTGATVLQDAFGWLDRQRTMVHTRQGRELRYDALVLAIGARTHPAYVHATTLDDRRLEEVFGGIVQDVEAGYLRRLAFVMPQEGCWPLPLYELALMTAERAREMSIDADITIATPERAPLAVFGDEASGAVSALLEDRGISVETHAHTRVPSVNEIVIDPGDRRISVDRVVALPELYGPSVRGLAAGEHGFIPIDTRCRVIGAAGVYAAGDATDFPVKHGGLAAQQADVVAADIAQLAGAPVIAKPFHAHIEGVLLTGRDPLYLTANVVGGAGFRSVVSSEPLWASGTKIVAKRLGAVLARLESASTATVPALGEAT